MPATVAEAIERYAHRLAEAAVCCGHGTATPRDEAAALIYHVMELEHHDPGAYGHIVAPSQDAKIQALLQARIQQRMPLPYLLGEAWFAGRRFFVDRRVLVPRSPFAELLLEGFNPWLGSHRVERILEVGTGSGCIAIVAALTFPHSQVVATDICADALAVARHNRHCYQLDERLGLLQTDLLSGLRGPFDLLITNPPYVPDGDLLGAPPEYEFEPALALKGGADGLELVAKILQDAPRVLAPDGLLALEVGDLAGAVEERWPGISFLWPQLRRGGAGIGLVRAADLTGQLCRGGRRISP